MTWRGFKRLPLAFAPQNKDLKGRVSYLEGSQKSNKEVLVGQLEQRIQELEERLEAEERWGAATWEYRGAALCESRRWRMKDGWPRDWTNEVAGMGLKNKEWGGHLEVEDQGLVEGMNVLVSSIQPWILKHRELKVCFIYFSISSYNIH